MTESSRSQVFFIVSYMEFYGTAPLYNKYNSGIWKLLRKEVIDKFGITS